MSKKKSKKRATTASPEPVKGKRDDGDVLNELSEALTREILKCEDGRALARKHALKLDGSHLVMGVYSILWQLTDKSKYGLPTPDENDPALDYLELALNMLGQPDLARYVKRDLNEVINRFLDDKENILASMFANKEKSKTYDLLLND